MYCVSKHLLYFSFSSLQGCKWSFTTSSKLRRHQRKHTQVRKHQCKTCKKSFLRSEHLRDHSLKHFVKNSFICPIAGKKPLAIFQFYFFIHHCHITMLLLVLELRQTTRRGLMRLLWACNLPIGDWRAWIAINF